MSTLSESPAVASWVMPTSVRGAERDGDAAPCGGRHVRGSGRKVYRRRPGGTVVVGAVRQSGGCPSPRHRSSSGMGWRWAARSGSEACSGRTRSSSTRHCPQARQTPQSGSAPVMGGPYAPTCTSTSCVAAVPGLAALVGRPKSQTCCGKTPSSASGTACPPDGATSLRPAPTAGPPCRNTPPRASAPPTRPDSHPGQPRPTGRLDTVDDLVLPFRLTHRRRHTATHCGRSNTARISLVECPARSTTTTSRRRRRTR